MAQGDKNLQRPRTENEFFVVMAACSVVQDSGVKTVSGNVGIGNFNISCKATTESIHKRCIEVFFIHFDNVRSSEYSSANILDCNVNEIEGMP